MDTTEEQPAPEIELDRLRTELAAVRSENKSLAHEVWRRGNIIEELKWRCGSSLGGLVVDFKPGAQGRYSDGFGPR